MAGLSFCVLYSLCIPIEDFNQIKNLKRKDQKLERETGESLVGKEVEQCGKSGGKCE